MKAKELLDANKLTAAIAEITQQVKSHPADSRLRTFLFETLCLAGDYERAERQLDVIGHQNESAGIGVEVYRQLIKAEQAREQVFHKGARPAFVLPPPSCVEHHLEAINQLRRENSIGVREALERSAAERRPIQGILNGQPFSSIRESDDILGPILECFLKGTYAWIPIEQIRKLTIVPPKHLRDMLWIQASVELADFPPGDIFLPVLYEGSEREDDDQLRLGRMTDWRPVIEEVVTGVGQRTFLVDAEDKTQEKALLEIRELEVFAR